MMTHRTLQAAAVHVRVVMMTHHRRQRLLCVCRYATILIPSLVLAPEYFAGAIEFGTMTQVGHTLTLPPRVDIMLQLSISHI